MHILIMSMEAGRYGPARLPEAFALHGVDVSVLCSPDNLLAASQFIEQHFTLPHAHAIGVLARAVSQAVLACGATLVVPSDEQSVVLLQVLARDTAGRLIEPQVRGIIAASLGTPARFAASLFKSDTIRLARTLGLPVPAGGPATDREHARKLAARLGYPVYLKASFSWAGRGVVRCENEAQLLRAFPRPHLWRGARHRARRLLGRDWFPVDTQIDVQEAIAGESALFCGVAWRGRMLGGYGGLRLEQACPNGPSRSIRLLHHPQMASMAATMVAALGFTGFFSFDFMLPAESDRAVLIECNPRLVPMTHLGRQIGVDQAGLLAACLRGAEPRPPVFATRPLDVLLFPHALSARPDESTLVKDMPYLDDGLLDWIHYPGLQRRKAGPPPAATPANSMRPQATVSPALKPSPARWSAG
jgi:hypothetical protein